VVGVVCPDAPPLLGLVSLLAPPLCAGNAVVLLGSDASPLPAAIFGEICATSDVPAGAVNIITGQRDELLEHMAQHRDVDAIHAANLSRKQSTTLKLGAAENVKRVHVRSFDDEQWYDAAACDSPWMIEGFVEMKTIWHPSST
jgi:acyl-CoA reductase-like NAD-dependent aldehyde dehydrogenase